MNLIKQFEQNLSEVKKPAKKMGFQAGATVRLKDSSGTQKETAKIKAMLDDIEGGVFLYTPLDGSRYWNVDDLELMISDGVFEASAPKSDRLYYVMIPANVYAGRYYEFKAAQVKVLASSRDEAIELVNTHKDDVLRFLGTRRVQPSGRTLLPAKEPAKKNVFFKDTYYVRELGATSSNDVLTRHGGFKQVRVGKNVSEASQAIAGATIGSAAEWLYSHLKNSSEGRRADWTAPNGDTARVEMEVRYFGKWVMPPGEEDDGDYDWEVLSDETKKKLDAVLDDYARLFPTFPVRVEIGEKNWIMFTIKPKAK